MVCILKLGIVSIPVMQVNYTKSRYSSESMHQFSSCCNKPVGNKKVCKGCGKELPNMEILKGLDERTILSEDQQEALKNYLENGVIEIISIKDVDSLELSNLMPLFQKTQLILPSISKGYRKTDLKTFFSFKSALSELNKICIVKCVQRGLEHLGLICILNGDMVFIEVPFKNYHNLDEISRLKEGVNNILEVEKVINPTEFKEQAKEFISSFNPNEERDLDNAVEEKKLLIKKFIQSIRDGTENEFLDNQELNPVQREVNPFSK